MTEQLPTKKNRVTSIEIKSLHGIALASAPRRQVCSHGLVADLDKKFGRCNGWPPVQGTGGAMVIRKSKGS